MSKPSLSVVGRTRPDKNRQDAERVLKEMLARVESGEVIEVAVAGLTRDQCCTGAASKMSNRILMIGALSRLLFSLQQDMERMP